METIPFKLVVFLIYFIEQNIVIVSILQQTAKSKKNYLQYFTIWLKKNKKLKVSETTK